MLNRVAIRRRGGRPRMTGEAAAGLCGLLILLSGCVRPDEASRPAAEDRVSWTVSWDAVTAAEDGRPLAERPVYEVQMSAGSARGPWETVWRGSSTTAVVSTLPGSRCFRAVAVTGETRSQASEVICGTKRADDTVRHADAR